MELTDIDEAKMFTISTTQLRLWEASPSIQPDRHCLVLVISTQRRDHVLAQVLPDGSLTLPVAQPLATDVKTWDSDMNEIELYLKKVLGVRMRVSRSLWAKQKKCSLWGRQYASMQVLLLEPLGELTFANERARWVSLNRFWQLNWFELNKCMELDLAQFIVGTMRFDNEIFPTAKPWFFITCAKGIEAWVTDVLTDKDMEIESEMEVLHLRRTSIMWSCTVSSEFTDESGTERLSETIYVKASLPMTREGHRMSVVEDILEDAVPIIVAVHESECLIIHRDAGSIDDEKHNYTQLMNTLAQLHVRTMNQLGKLKATGVRVRDANWLISNIIWITYHPATNKLMESSVGGMLNVQRLRSQVENIIKGCRKLCSYQIPDTLVVGDLRFENIGCLELSSNFYRFYNWENAVITHPFTDPGSWRRLNEFKGSEEAKAAIKMYCHYWCTYLDDKDYDLVLDLGSLLHCGVAVHRLLVEYELYGVGEEEFLEALNEGIVSFSEQSSEIAQKYF